MSLKAYYAVVRYVPDPVRGEQVNVGVIVVSEKGEFVGARFDRDFTRAKCVGRREDVSFLRDFARSFEVPRARKQQLLLPMPGGTKWNADVITDLHREWANSIQLSEPRAAIETDPLELVDEVFERYVASPPAIGKSRARDRRWILQQTVPRLRTLAKERFPDREADQIVRRRDTLTGHVEEHVFDLVLRLERPLYAVEALSFENEDRDELARAVDSTAWAIDDVRKSQRDLPIAVLAIDNERSPEFRRVERICTALHATLVRESDLQPWVVSTIRGLDPTLVGHAR